MSRNEQGVFAKPTPCSGIKTVLGSLLMALVLLANGQAAPEPDKAAKPKVYALVAALGDEFTLISQKPTIGSRLSPYVRLTIDMPKNTMNRAVLVGLDEAMASTDPGSKRVYFTLPVADKDSLKDYERESVAISDVVSILEKMPERAEWDSIVIATPAYKAFELNGVPGRLSGFGVFYQGLRGIGFGDENGEDGETPEGKYVRNQRYTAPFSFIEVWVLDAKTMKVIDRQRRFDNKKLFDPLAGTQNITQNIDKTVLMKNVASLIERSTFAAVTHSEILNRRGLVDVGNVKEAKPGAENK